MKLNTDLKLRTIGSHYMIVKAGDNADLTDVFTFNSTAAWLWEKIGNADFTEDMLVKWLCREYEVEEWKAAEDVRALLKDWRRYGFIAQTD